MDNATLVLDRAAARSLATGGDLGPFLSTVQLDQSVRPAAGLKMKGADVTMGSGASITLDPGASLGMTATGQVELAGSIRAPGGSVTLTANGTGLSSPGSVLIDSGAVISVAGEFVPTPTTTPNVVKGNVLGGGSISLTTTPKIGNASVIVQQGALLDVSGSSGDIDLVTTTGAAPVRTHVTSDAGTITVRATHPSRIDGTLRGVAQGSSAGGTFAFDFVKADSTDTNDTTPRRLIVGAAPVATGSTPLQGSLAGSAPFDAYFSASSLQGIDKLRLHAESQIQFAGNLDVSLARSVRLDSPEFVATPGTSTVRFSAPQIAFGGTLAEGVGMPAAPVAGSMGTGSASLVLSTGSGDSGLAELFGHTRLPGFGSVSVTSAGDLRLTGLIADSNGDGVLDTVAGSFWTSGNVALTAAQIYPATFTSFTLGVDSPTGVISIAGNGAPRAPVYSAGGSLTLQASTIEQGGVVKAPLGQLAFNATGGRIDLLPGSVTSVSADGLTIPYGGTQAGVAWSYDGAPVTAPPTKRITLTGKDVSVQPGAKVDLSGGGEIAGTEWIQGPGGSTDFLASSGVYAVIPGVKFTPFDAHLAGVQNLGFGNDSNVYDSVYLSGGAGLPAGTYALLPGYYALLPGAYVVQLQKGYTDLPAGQAAATAFGQVVSGYRTVAGTDIRESRTSGFLVRPGAAARNQAEYSSTDSSFFANQATASGLARPILPQDAGTLVLSASSTLQLSGNLQMQAAPGGAIGELDVVSSNISIGSSAPAGYLRLDPGALSSIGARLLIGGSNDGTGNLSVSASNVLLQNDASTALAAPDIVLAATGSVTLAPGSVIQGTGAYSGPTTDLTTAGPGALLHVSSGPAVSLSRTGNPLAGGGSLVIGAGATVHGDQAVLLDSTGSSTLAGLVSVGTGGTLDLGGPRISLGQVPGGTSGLVLNPDQLAAASGASNLVLRSYSSIDFYGDTTIGHQASITLGGPAPSSPMISNLTLRSGGLGGHSVGGAGTATISADTIQLDNRVGGVFAGAPTGTGTLNLNARNFVFGDGAATVSGFTNVNIAAADTFTAAGTGSLAVSGNLNINTARITATTGVNSQGVRTASNQSISATTNVALTASGSSSTSVLNPGGHLSFSAATITNGTSIALPSGVLSLSSSGDLVLDNGSVTSAAAYTKDFFGTLAFADAGTVNLASSSGNVIVRQGAVVDVSAPSGGNAGTLSLSAISAGKAVQLGGTVLGGATPGFTGGNAQLDAGSLAGFSSLNSTLASGGFTGSRSFRLRSGDLTVGANDVVTANQVTLIADAGSITFNGTIDASGNTGGGRVELDAANTLTLAGGSRILANGNSTGTGASDPYTNGGLVRLSSRSTASGITLNFASNASIDVSAGAKGDAGRVEFYTTRTPSANASLQGTITGNGNSSGQQQRSVVVVYGNQVYTVAAGNIDITTGQADAASFMGSSGAAAAFQQAIAGTLKLTGLTAADVNVRPAVELQSSGNLTLTNPWDLTASAWNYSTVNGSQPGLLTIRSQGTLDIQATLGLPNPTPPASGLTYPSNPQLIPTDTKLFGPEAIPTTPTWSIQLVGGSDTTSANRLAVKPLASLTNTGNVTLTVVQTTTPLTASGKPTLQAPNWRTGQSVRVRTGTGDIEIAAGADFKFVDGITGSSGDQLSRDLINASRAAVYTTGRPVTGANDANGGNRFLTGGGAVRIYAQRDAVGLNLDGVKVSGWGGGNDAVFNQVNQPALGDWLRKSSATADAAGWWADRRLFSGSVGSFGGGAISIVAGHNVDHLSAMNTSSARVTGTVTTRGLDVEGGGVLLVRAGGDVLGGDYLVSNNVGTIQAGGMVGGTARTGLYLIGVSTDTARDSASLQVNAVGDISIQNISNPTIFGSSLQSTQLGLLGIPVTGNGSDGFGALRASFFSYSPTDQVSLVSAGGNVDLDGTARAARSASNYGTWFNVAPPRLSITAMNGNVTDSRLDPSSGKLNLPANDAQHLFPSANQSLQVLAGGDISNMHLEADDALPSILPAWNKPMRQSGDPAPSPTNLVLGGPTTQVARLVTPSTDSGNVYDLSAQGSIYDLEFSAPKAATIQAGLDLDNVKLDLQNLAPTDLSIVRAGRDIRYEPTYRSGRAAAPNHIFIDGPGALLVQAGRNIDLGTTDGIQARGNQSNSSLPTTNGVPPAPSARLTIVAGYTGDLSLGEVDQFFTGLTAAGQATISAQVCPGLTTACVGTQRALLGDAVIASVLDPRFISSVGNVTMYKSTIQTVGNSGIDFVVPSGAPHSQFGGNINAGLPIQDPTRELGIITKFGGAIRAYTQNDFVVNQSKVVTQLSGDIIAYSNYGSIDAGRGSRAARSSPAPTQVRLADGSIVLVPPGGGSGSGIGTFSYDPDGAGPLPIPTPGNVLLFANRGTINAGEAGIRSAGNVFISAQQVLNAQNISAQGTSTGVPVAATGSLAGALAGATSSASSAVQSAVDSLQAAKAVDRPATISVRVLGFGDDGSP
jgi:hypothetical protein